MPTWLRWGLDWLIGVAVILVVVLVSVATYLVWTLNQNKAACDWQVAKAGGKGGYDLGHGCWIEGLGRIDPQTGRSR